MDSPDSLDILLMPFLCALIGGVIYGLAWANFRGSLSLPKWRWIGLVFIALALYMSLQNVWRLYEPSMGYIYMKSVQGRGRVLQSHYLAALIALAAAALAGIVEVAARRLKA